ncbi:hypothetical protein VP01_8327g1 [Puccinia sorghi]|uniref:Uncharacterized protein n=1 Tax=Puccinia sorghi TaxID=27349 RepID=A0A0L6U9M4_9BASI|nr:hypothetical protein VP01_8327g1 [Puccinia sorghi]
MTKAQVTATKAKVVFLRNLREMGLAFEEINKKVDEEFLPIHDALADCDSEDSNSDEESS